MSLALAAGAALLACETSTADLREWTPEDHDKPARPQGQVPARPRTADPGGDARALVEVTWHNQCASCHGARGAGDGPQGAMVRAPDLTRPEWLDRVSDAQIAASIRTGRGKMPAFDLPPAVVDALVGRIRAHRAGAR